MGCLLFCGEEEANRTKPIPTPGINLTQLWGFLDLLSDTRSRKFTSGPPGAQLSQSSLRRALQLYCTGLLPWWSEQFGGGGWGDTPREYNKAHENGKGHLLSSRSSISKSGTSLWETSGVLEACASLWECLVMSHALYNWLLSLKFKSWTER